MSELPYLEGAACADLPPHVIDKYFNPPTGSRGFEQKIARAICGRCVAITECWQEALRTPPDNGIQAGHNAAEIKRIRRAMYEEHSQVSVRYLNREQIRPVVEPLVVLNKKPAPVPGVRYPERRQTNDEGDQT